MIKTKRGTLASVVLGVSIMMGACGGGGKVEPVAIAASAPAAVVAQVETKASEKKPGAVCGAPTKAGGACKRRVRHEGLRCWMHGGPGKAELDAEGAKPKQ